MTGSVDLRPDYEEAVKRILAEYVPECEVRAFGSRAAWTAKDYSDLDLAVGGEGPLDWRTLDRLKEAFEESDLPMRVDVLDWHTISDSFREVIERDYVVMQERAKQAMTGGWREVALGEIAEIFDGPHATPQKTDRGPVFLGISNLVNGRIDLSTTQHLSEEDYLTWTRRVTPMPGDVVFSYETRLGEAAAIPHGLRCCLGRRMGLLRPRTERVAPHFLLYAYLGPRFQETLRARAVQGSTVDRILLTEMGAFPIAIPVDVAEQRAIAHVLGRLDDKIELNRRMNETLEAMARALFKSWFVDFDPVRAKMEGRWRRGESLPGLPAELYDVFPGRLVGSELGEVPEGWEVRSLGEVADVSSGKRPNHRLPAANDEAQIPLWGGNGPMAFVAEPLVDFPILLTGRVGTLGSVFRITTPCWPSDNTLIVTAKSSHFFDYLFYQMERIDYDALNRGSTQPLLTQSDLKNAASDFSSRKSVEVLCESDHAIIRRQIHETRRIRRPRRATGCAVAQAGVGRGCGGSNRRRPVQVGEGICWTLKELTPR